MVLVVSLSVVSLVLILIIGLLIAHNKKSRKPVKRDIDMSAISFNNKTVKYDGNEHEITIAGKLPDGVSVNYRNNKLTEIGSTVATAVFSHNNPNYNEIPNMSATLTIEEPNYDFKYSLSENEATITEYKGCGRNLSIPEYIRSENNQFYKVTSIGDCAFQGCGNLQSIEIPKSVTSIGDGAFQGCGSLKSIEIPDGVTSIGRDEFLGCSSLTSIVIPNSVTKIGNRAFWGCSSLKSIKIPKGVTSIEENTFKCCDALESVVIPNSVTKIGNSAFWGCSSLKSVEIPEGVTVIDDYAFKYCDNLESIVIPGSMTSIGDCAFKGCVYYEGTEKKWNSISKNTNMTEIIYFYRKTKPNDDGNYWHYDNGKPIVWTE